MGPLGQRRFFLLVLFTAVVSIVLIYRTDSFSYFYLMSSRQYMNITCVQFFDSTTNYSIIVQALFSQVKALGQNCQIKMLPQYSAEKYTTPREVEWFDDYRYYDDYKEHFKRNRSIWTKAFTKEDHHKLMDLFKVMTELFSKHKIEYMITEGSLMGSMRHFDQIPWDDDSDILVDDAHRKDLPNIIKQQTISSDLDFHIMNEELMKVFHKSSKAAGKYTWKYPFIDVFLYKHNATHIKRRFRNIPIHTPKADVFPLSLRPYGKYWLPAPKNPMNYLQRLNYSTFQKDCYRGTWNHRLEVSIRSGIIPCQRLKHIYSFTEPIKVETDLGTYDFQSFTASNKQRIFLTFINSSPLVVYLS